MTGEGEHDIALMRVDPKGTAEKLGVLPANFGRANTTIFNVQIVGMSFKYLGQYRFQLKSGKRSFGRPCIIEVKRQKTAAKRKKS